MSGRGGDPRALTWDQGSLPASPGGPALRRGEAHQWERSVLVGTVGGGRSLPWAGPGPPGTAAPADSASFPPPDALAHSPGEQGDTEALKGRQRRRGIAPPPSALLPPQPGSDLSCVQSPLPPPSIPCTHHPRRLVPSWEVWTRDEPLPLKGPSGAGWHPWW